MLIKVFLAIILVFFMGVPVSATESKQDDPDKVTREANLQTSWYTWYKDWVYYWGRNEAEKDTKVTNAFFRERMDGSEKKMLSDWNEKVADSQFKIENNSIYYKGYEYTDNRWKYSLKRMDLDGSNKSVILDNIPLGSFQIEGNLLYIIDYDSKTCPDKLEDYRPGVMLRINLDTKKRDVLKKCFYPRMGTVTAKGIYIEDEFYPTGSTKSQKSKLKNVWKQIDHESPEQLEIQRDPIIPDQGTIYYMIWSRRDLTDYLFKYNETSGKSTLIKKIPPWHFGSGPSIRMVNVHRGYAYFDVLPFGQSKREIHRMSLKGGDIVKVMDIPPRLSFAIINGNVFFINEDNEIVSRVPLKNL